MSLKLRKLAANMNVIKNKVIIKHRVRAMGKNTVQRNGAFYETSKLLHIHSLLPHHLTRAYTSQQSALETAEKGFRW